MNTQYLTIWDLVLTPIYLGILIFIAKRYRDRHYPVGNPLRKYYLPGLYVKFFGAIFIGLIYQFYYHGGDTFNFYTDSRIMNSSFDDSFNTWLKLLLRKSPDADPKLFAYTSQMNFYHDPASHMVSMIGALFGILNFTSYMPVALLFAFFSYTGIWSLYKTFADIYPGLIKPLAVAVLFIPSTFVWGSAIFKDTICIFGIGWMVYSTFRIFMNRDFSIKNIFMLVLSFYLVAVVKLYIIVAFIPALCIWILMSYSHKIKSSGARFIASILFVGFTVAGFIFFANLFAEDMKSYSLENLSKTADATRGYIMYATGDEGSVYDIGEFDGTIGGTLKKFPAGVIVTLFRPFPWEAKKVIAALSAIEALLFLYFTLKVFLSRKVKLRVIFKNPTVLFCLIFSLIFAFSVGISAGNFGTLSRYKIPCLPFYGAFLMICLNYRGQKLSVVKSGKQLQKTALVSDNTV